jgi:hypothetical protein
MWIAKLEELMTMLQLGKQTVRWLCCFRCKSESIFKEEWDVYDPHKASINRAYDYMQQRHRMPYGLLYNVNLQLFVMSIDPLCRWHMLQSIVHPELILYTQTKNLV